MIYNLIPDKKLKLRVHFNKFMLDIHRRIHAIKNDSATGSDESFDILAKQLINEVNIIFFDEFQVTDIADAMLMSRLFTALFDNGIILFCTSNRVPQDLYKNGLQRQLFLPFIDILEHYCTVICLDSPNDYRKLSNASLERIYFHSDFENELVNRVVADLVKRQDGNASTDCLVDTDHLIKLKRRTIEILGRTVVLEKTYKRLLDTSFSFICEESRSALDYLRLCELFDVIVLRNIPGELKDPNSIRRFITFIDTIYDNKIKFVCSGQASCVQLLFNVNKLQENAESNELSRPSNEQSVKASLFTLDEEIFAIERTVSRLIDMQSEAYRKLTKF